MRSRESTNPKKALTLSVVLTMAGALAACSGGSSLSPASGVLPGQQSAAQRVDPAKTVTPVYGGGAFIISLVARSWMDNYGITITPPQPSGPVAPNTQLLYAAIGSGNGVTAFLTQTPSNATPTNPPPYTSTLFPNYPYPEWDYSTSETPLSSSQISQYQSTVQTQRGIAIEVPITADGIAVPYNKSGLTLPAGGLQISVNSLCGIFTGGITNWNDSHITADNNGVQVSPNLPILIVFRSDSAGTTFLISNHLNTACAGSSFPWTGGVGNTVTWPSNSIGESGAAGVSSEIAATAGSIGYNGVEYLGAPYNIPSANLQDNYAETHPTFTPQYVAVTKQSVNLALKAVTLPSNPTPSDILNDTIVPDPSSKSAWPIAGFSYIDLYQCYATAPLKKNIVGFVQWVTSTALPAGQSLPDQIAVAGGVNYLPNNLKKVTSKAMKQLVKGPVTGVCTL